MSLNDPFPVLPAKVNNYILEKLIGKGGFGYVYLATSTTYQCQFAVKVGIITENDIIKREKIKRSFESEFNALKKLDHPNIIRLYDYFDKDDLIFLVLEYCPNGSLEDYIRESEEMEYCEIYSRSQARFSPQTNAVNDKNIYRFSFISSMADKFKISVDIIKAIQYCHENNFAHRDIKTANILFDENGRPKIADFGLARFISDEERIITHEGTALFAAPELFKKNFYDPYKADIWALGVLLYRFFTFKFPFIGNDMKSLAKIIQEACLDFRLLMYVPSMKNIIQKMLQVDPSARISLRGAIAEAENELNQYTMSRINSLPERITLKTKKTLLIQATKGKSNGTYYKSFGYPRMRMNRNLCRDISTYKLV